MEILICILILLFLLKSPSLIKSEGDKNVSKTKSTAEIKNKTKKIIKSPPIGSNPKGYFDKQAFTQTYNKLRGK